MQSVDHQDSGNDAALGRRVEQFAAAILLVLAFLPMLVAALLVWRSIGTPLLFAQTRIGRHMQPFQIKKLRTMRDTRDREGNLLPDHLRETPATRMMRRMRIDELPQLLAIIRGEMSFIGPRPLLPTTIQSMGELGRLRSSVRPGLSGWAQVNGNTLLTDEQKLSLDIWYVIHKSPSLNAEIFMRTLWTLIWGQRIDLRNLSKAESFVRERYAKLLNCKPGDGAA